jgi:hypothetical protein
MFMWWVTLKYLSIYTSTGLEEFWSFVEHKVSGLEGGNLGILHLMEISITKS